MGARSPPPAPASRPTSTRHRRSRLSARSTRRPDPSAIPIAHVGEAAERDRAQTAAHDEALRAELAARRDKLDTPPARFEARHREDYARQLRAVEERRAQVERATADREAVEALGWRERRQKLPYATESERLFSERLTEERAKLAQTEPPGTEIRREHEIAAQLLDARSAQALTAARIEPPSYIVKELGERPADPIKARSWDHGVQGVERYRLEHGVSDQGQRLRPRAARRPSAGDSRGRTEKARRGSAPPWP